MVKLKELMKSDGVRFIVLFLSIYIILYYGTMFLVGIAVPGGRFHNEYLEKNGVGYVIAIRQSLLYGAEMMMKLLNYDVYIIEDRTLRIVNGNGVYMHNSCIGYGIFSFWIAFILANRNSLKKKLQWLFGGLFLLWLINVFRVCLILISNYHAWPSVGKIDHHTLFNITAYIAILALMYFYTRKRNLPKSISNSKVVNFTNAPIPRN